ncbi:m7GpppN-mRNA hydrolase-like isoform X1 [Macrosteles quadrilineatus]|uniref:m7GpppN-mRNA hydrolase-like isoform X1 n=1 Tax=Macrosteles quadrilineatus TaxID=74068 RepID=UPI0023E316F7|nr:m7GpppN-mRNA hydrolase-like isoform X1 [Macrosteles quadrilineatus]
MDLNFTSKPGEHTIPLDVINDLSSRFIINIPEEERRDPVRVLFQVELAHWFYLDFYCAESYPVKFKPCSMKEFTTHIFQHIPTLQQYVSNVDEVISTWKEYKQAVPTFGAILLSQDLTHVLLVQSYWAKSSWGFPKGKVNQDEEPHKCAAREVLEETGFDISNLLNQNEYIEATIHEQLVRLYIIPGVPLDTKFEPKTRNEIKAVEWFPVSDLPSNKKDVTPKVKMGVNTNSFFMVLPFIRRIRKWIQERQQKNTRGRQRYKSMGELEVRPREMEGMLGSTSVGPKAKRNTSSMVPQVNATVKYMFSMLLQIEQCRRFGMTITEIDTSRQTPQAVKSSCASPPRNSGRKERKQNTKARKQLLANQDGERSKPVKNGTKKLPNDPLPLDFKAPSWMNFKFNRQAILQTLG